MTRLHINLDVLAALEAAPGDPDAVATLMTMAAAYIRSDEPLPLGLKERLADALEAAAAAPERERAAILARLLGLTAGHKRPKTTSTYAVGSRFEDLIDEGKGPHEAAQIVAVEHDIGEATARRLHKKYLAAVEAGKILD